MIERLLPSATISVGLAVIRAFEGAMTPIVELAVKVTAVDVPEIETIREFTKLEPEVTFPKVQVLGPKVATPDAFATADAGNIEPLAAFGAAVTTAPDTVFP